MWHPTSDKKCKSTSANDGRSGSSCKELIRGKKCLKKERLIRFCLISKRKMKTKEKKTLEDWIAASPGLKPEYLMRGEVCESACKQFKKKVHPYLSQFHGSLLAEAKDSLCLDRHINGHEEGEGIPSCSSITKSRSFSGKSHKRVSFKLPHIVTYYSPEEQESYYSGESENSSICRENSFESEEEPLFRLAVDILPHVYVSSKI
ncbi:hypothetical protein VNO77_05960 [Canavalia gladiata]|uniref:Uncharacterized protein n=1 Tax=Canavalia gladiata TaxID=3824 RepID=A0AAN9N4H9_CANGL